MSRGRAKDPETVRGVHAWGWMRRDPGYRAAWAARAAAPRFEAAAFPIRVQTEADLRAAADWALLSWEDPVALARRSPFWSGVPMLVGEPDPDPWPDPTPLLGLLAGAGARVEGLRAAERPVRPQGGAGRRGIADSRAVRAAVRARRRDHGQARAEPAAGDAGRAHRRPVGSIGRVAPSTGAGPGGENDKLLTVRDGLEKGKKPRPIAMDIWGPERVAAEWTSDSWMRSQMRRWIPRARALAAGGWRDLVPRHAPEEWQEAATVRPGQVDAVIPAQGERRESRCGARRLPIPSTETTPPSDRGGRTNGVPG